MSNNETLGNLNKILKTISAQDFQNFGAQEIAYIRTAKLHDKTLFILHSANGQRLSVMNTLNDAISIARHNDLEPVTVH